MKIIALVGSIRKESYNQKITEFIQQRYAEKLEIEIYPLNDIPIFNQDQELDPPAIVKDLKDKILASEGVLIATPEYNHSIPGVLKNVLDWTSRGEKVLDHKPVMVVGASMGALGTIRAQIHLRQILQAAGVKNLLLPGNEVLIGAVHTKVDEAGNLTDEPTINFLDIVVDNYIEWIKKHK